MVRDRRDVRPDGIRAGGIRVVAEIPVPVRSGGAVEDVSRQRAVTHRARRIQKRVKRVGLSHGDLFAGRVRRHRAVLGYLAGAVP